MRYEHDENGNLISGDLQRLIDEVDDGDDLKVVLITPYGTKTTDATNVWTGNGRVYIQGWAISSSFSGDDLSFYYPNDYYFFTNFDTSGRLQASRYYMDGTAVRTSEHTFGAKWYTRGRNNNNAVDEMELPVQHNAFGSNVNQTGDLWKIMWMLLGIVIGYMMALGRYTILRFSQSATKSTESQYATINTPLIQ